MGEKKSTRVSLNESGYTTVYSKDQERWTVARPKKSDKCNERYGGCLGKSRRERAAEEQFVLGSGERPATPSHRCRCMLASPHGQCSIRLSGPILRENL